MFHTIVSQLLMLAISIGLIVFNAYNMIYHLGFSSSYHRFMAWLCFLAIMLLVVSVAFKWKLYVLIFQVIISYLKYTCLKIRFWFFKLFMK